MTGIDGQNRMVADPTAGATYVYDGNGTRVQKCLPNCTSPSSSTVFVFSGSQDIAEYDNGAAPTSPSREFVYSDGLPGSGLLATLTGGSSPTVTYFHDDHLSWRISTDGTPGSPTYGQVIGQQGHGPFGDGWYSSNGNEFVFTSYQLDAESGLDYAMARYYDSTAGRFCSADPVGGQLDDPQTWDRYSYVRNDPINLTDPNGQSWLNWVIDAIVTALVIALPELAPEEFSFLGGSSAAADGTSWALSTGKIASLGTGIIGTETVTTSSIAAGLVTGGAAAELGVGAQSQPAKAPQPQQTRTNCNLITPSQASSQVIHYRVASNAVGYFQSSFASQLARGIRALNAQNIIPTITRGFRTPADQLLMRMGGSGSNPAAVVSWHQQGLAADFGLNANAGANSQIQSAMTQQGITWGGKWRRPDPVHYQQPPSGTRSPGQLKPNCPTPKGGVF